MNAKVSLFTPDYSHLTGLLSHLNAEELKELLNSDEKTAAIINDLKQVKDIEAEREMLLASNRSISEYNLSQKPTLEQHRKQVEETFQIALDLKTSLLDKKKKIECKQQSTSKDTLLALLQTAGSEMDEEAESAVDHFLKSELSIEDFLEKYLELRKLAHLRRIKSEKLAKMLEEDGTRISTPPTRPQRLRKLPAPPTPTFTRYPYPNMDVNGLVQNNIPIAPARPAPQPPVYAPNMPYPAAYAPHPSHPAPYAYATPYPHYSNLQQQSYPRYK